MFYDFDVFTDFYTIFSTEVNYIYKGSKFYYSRRQKVYIMRQIPRILCVKRVEIFISLFVAKHSPTQFMF